jgi:hypothetical protein
MTPTAQYPRSRYVAMQVALFVILLATVALASWVSHRHVVAVVSRSRPISLGDFTLQMPGDWALEKKQTPNAIQVAATEPDDTGRQIIALFQQLRAPVPPMDYLQEKGLATDSADAQQMMVDGNPGAYIAMMRLMDRDGQRVLVKDLLACVMLPSGQVLTLQLTGPGRLDESDQQLMQQLLTDLKIKPQKKLPVHPSPQEWEGI